MLRYRRGRGVVWVGACAEVWVLKWDSSHNASKFFKRWEGGEPFSRRSTRRSGTMLVSSSRSASGSSSPCLR
jgi:hypothetical protein